MRAVLVVDYRDGVTRRKLLKLPARRLLSAAVSYRLRPPTHWAGRPVTRTRIRLLCDWWDVAAWSLGMAVVGFGVVKWIEIYTG